MPQRFPLSNYGNRMINVTVPTGETYWIRAYYSEGQINAWFFDMWDANMGELVKGIPIVIGSANLLGAYPDKIPAGAKIVAVLTDNEQGSPDALGNGLELVWYGPDEQSPYVIGDPMLAATSTDFVIPGTEETNDHNLLSNRFIPNQHNIPAIQGLADALADRATIEQLNQKLSDAPQDGIVYGRRNSEWVPADGSSNGGGGTGDSHFTVDGSSLIMLFEGTGERDDSYYFYRDGRALVMRRVAL